MDAGKATGNLATILARADQRLKEIKTAIDGINRWVNDSKLQADVRETMANAHDVTDKLDKSADQVNKTLATARTPSTSLPNTMSPSPTILAPPLPRPA